MNGILQYVILSVGLLSLSIIVLRFLHIVACINSSFLFVAEQYIPQFNFFLPAEYLFFPHVLVIANKAAINVHG